MLKPEEISDFFSTEMGKDLYDQSHKVSKQITLNMVENKLRKFEKARLMEEKKAKKHHSSEDEKEEIEEINENLEETIRDSLSIIPNEDLSLLKKEELLFPCLFRFEKEDKRHNSYYSIESEDSLNLEELTDFNKIMERQLNTSLTKEFHEKFHNVHKIHNKAIDKKLEHESKNRNIGQLKYLIKKRVSNLKDNIDDVKVKLESLDQQLVDPDREDVANRAENFFLKKSSKKSKSQNIKLMQNRFLSRANKSAKEIEEK